MESLVASGKRSERASAGDSGELSALGHCVARRWRRLGRAECGEPEFRILSMHAVEHDGAVIIMGEVVNEDTVPAFVTVGRGADRQERQRRGGREQL